MPRLAELSLARAVRDAAPPMAGEPHSFAPLLARIGKTSPVLTGEASHGTHEFYRIRWEITKKLIRTKGFTAVAVEYSRAMFSNRASS